MLLTLKTRWFKNRDKKRELKQNWHNKYIWYPKFFAKENDKETEIIIVIFKRIQRKKYYDIEGMSYYKYKFNNSPIKSLFDYFLDQR